MNTIYCVISEQGMSVHYDEAAALCKAEYLVSKHGGDVQVLAFDVRTGRHIVTVSECQEVAA